MEGVTSDCSVMLLKGLICLNTIRFTISISWWLQHEAQPPLPPLNILRVDQLSDDGRHLFGLGGSGASISAEDGARASSEPLPGSFAEGDRAPLALGRGVYELLRVVQEALLLLGPELSSLLLLLLLLPPQLLQPGTLLSLGWKEKRS